MIKYIERLNNGIIKENPTFVLMLGLCPTLAVTKTAFGGAGMGLTTTAVLVLSNLLISMLRKVIPNKVRIPAYIVVIASFVTLVQMLLEAYIPSVNDVLGIYIPLIVVNCIILGRAESFAAKNKPMLSLFDGIGMGLGFAVGLTLIGGFREVIGNGTFFGFLVMPQAYEPIRIFQDAPGAFFVLAMLTALQNKFKLPSATNGSAKKSTLSCGTDCSGCTGSSCSTNRDQIDKSKEEVAVTKITTPAKPSVNSN